MDKINYVRIFNMILYSFIYGFVGMGLFFVFLVLLKSGLGYALWASTTISILLYVVSMNMITKEDIYIKQKKIFNLIDLWKSPKRKKPKKKR